MTPDAYRKQLARLVDDPHLIELAVRRRFNPEPIAFDEEETSSTMLAKSRQAMENGSRALLLALRDRHAAILRRLNQQGRFVEWH